MVDGGEMPQRRPRRHFSCAFVCTLSDPLNQAPFLSPISRSATQTARLHHRPSVQPTVTATPKQCGDVAPRSRPRVAVPTPPVDHPTTRPPWLNPGGISSQWCVTRTIGGLPGSVASVVSRTSNRSRAPKSRPANGSSNNNSSGSLMSARARRTCCRSPSEITPNGRPPMSPTPPRASERVRLLPVLLDVTVPPRLERSVAAADDDVARRQVGSELPGHCAAHQGDTRAQGPDVNRAQSGPEDLHRSGRRPQPRPSHLQECRLARSRSDRGSPNGPCRRPANRPPATRARPSRCTVTPLSAMAAGGPDPLTPWCRRHRPRDAG